MDDSRPPSGPPPGADAAGSPNQPPLGRPTTREEAVALLDEAAELLGSGDFDDAARAYRRIVGFDELAIHAAALFGLGQSLYRLDQEDAAVATWEAVLELPDTPSTYRAWREIAAARVRAGDLEGAIAAYREADRRAPAADRPEIANRLGWLAKETGNTGASRRYFARGRGATSGLPLPWLILGLTVVISFMGFSAEGGFIIDALALNKTAVAEGEYWRLWSVTLVHGSLLHLFFNMYALYLSGPIVERLYGSRIFLLLYLLCAAGGSVASYVAGAGNVAVGASGAIFGLIGVLLAASRTHHPVLDQQSRGFVGQLGTLIVINLILGAAIPRIDNAAHVGGLVTGLWLGFLLRPGRVPTLRSFWQGGEDSGRGSMVLPTLGVAALVGVLLVGVVIGTDARRSGDRADAVRAVVMVAWSAAPVTQAAVRAPRKRRRRPADRSPRPPARA